MVEDFERAMAVLRRVCVGGQAALASFLGWRSVVGSLWSARGLVVVVKGGTARRREVCLAGSCREWIGEQAATRCQPRGIPSSKLPFLCFVQVDYPVVCAAGYVSCGGDL